MTATPESVGFNSARLARLDRFVQERYIDAGRFPGAQIMIERGGQCAHHTVLGWRDVENRKPVEPDTIFRIYSMTKPVTAVAMLMLVEEGLIALDDPVEKHIPQWADLGVFEAGFLDTVRTRRTDRPMLVVDLFRHTSGLTYGFQQRSNVDAAYRARGIGIVGQGGTLQEMIDGLSDMPLEFSPGEAWNYSVSTDVLGYLIEKLSGQTLDVFFQERLFGPLGMVDTAFYVPDDKIGRFAACYELRPDALMALQDSPETSAYRRMPSFLSGGGGLVSTVSDYMAFCRMLLNGGSLGGQQVLSRKTIELMTANHLPNGGTLHDMSISLFSEAAYAGVGFGLGVAVSTDPAQTLVPGSTGEYFWGGLASTAFWIDPVEELSVVFMTQLMPSTYYPVRRELRTLVYAALND